MPKPKRKKGESSSEYRQKLVKHYVKEGYPQKQGDKWIVYKDRVKVGGGTTAMPSANYSAIPYFGIGSSLEWGNPTHFVNGLIDEVRLYNHALTIQEVEALYRNPSGFANAINFGTNF